jgi:phosphatidylglycerophosphate synthase
MASPEKTAADCYSAGERDAMVWTQKLRGRWLAPLLDAAGHCGIGADHVTLASLVAGLSFVPLYLWPGQPWWSRLAAMLALLAHVLLDGIDGPLARHLGTASRRGSFTDTVADQIVVTATTLALMVGPAPRATGWIAGLYLFLYAMVVAFAMVRNALGVPYTWLVRPRFWVYGWIAVDQYLWPGKLDWVLAGFACLLALKMASGFVAIRRML